MGAAQTLFLWQLYQKSLDLGWLTWSYRTSFPFAFLLLWLLLWTRWNSARQPLEIQYPFP